MNLLKYILQVIPVFIPVRSEDIRKNIPIDTIPHATGDSHLADDVLDLRKAQVVLWAVNQLQQRGLALRRGVTAKRHGRNVARWLLCAAGLCVGVV